MKRTKTSLRHEADRLFSRRVRSRGICQALSFDAVECAGPLQTAHVVRRRYLSVRWDDDNAACLCAAHHVYFTHHPLAEERFHNQLLSPARFAELKARAEKARGVPDYAEILQRLREVPV
jgi:hypothetical protein